VKLWNDLHGWATAKSAALRLCFRMTVAGILAYALAEMLALPQGYWAVFSSIIIMQASVGGSVKATIDRLVGTIGGAVAGAIVAYVLPHQNLLTLGIALVVALVPHARQPRGFGCLARHCAGPGAWPGHRHCCAHVGPLG
jgi:uncharacterized membrane protein YccC